MKRFYCMLDFFAKCTIYWTPDILFVPEGVIDIEDSDTSFFLNILDFPLTY
jgi:hypothetical protein